jgi:hypothetical protein
MLTSLLFGKTLGSKLNENKQKVYGKEHGKIEKRVIHLALIL